MFRKKPIGMEKEDWENMDCKVKCTIQLRLLGLVFSNVSREAILQELWETLGGFVSMRVLVYLNIIIFNFA